MPKKKKPPTSPFYYFMLEKKQYYKQKKILYTMEQLKDIISPEWNAMDLETKKKYEELAKLNKSLPYRSDRYASDGSRVSDNLKAEERLNQERQLTDLKIRIHICGNDDSLEVFKDRAAKQVHYVMCFNTLGYFNNQYIPVEIGIVEYSINHGITGSYHKIIDYGTIPPGCVGEAKAHSENTHQILYSDVERDGRYPELFEEIMSFIKANPDEEMPPIFTSFDAIPQTSGCLFWLARNSHLPNVVSLDMSHHAAYHNLWFGAFGRRASNPLATCRTLNVARFEDGLRIWSSARLLYELRNGIGEPLPSVEIAKDRLQSTAFNYTSGSRCEFHEAKDSECCALEYAKTICFLISDSVCKLFGVEITDRHLPRRSTATFQVLSPPTAPFVDAVSVPRSVRATTDSCFNHRNKYNVLDELDEVEDVYSSSNQTIGRGSRLPQHSPIPSVQTLSRNLAMMNLGASGYNPASGIGRGRPSK